MSFPASVHADCSSSSVPGTGLLRFTRVGSRTIVERAFAVSPLKMLTVKPRSAEDAVWVYTATYGGGLVGGDAIRLTVDVDCDARAVLATQSSTKIYRSSQTASQHINARVRDDAWLVVGPDPVVCFADSRFEQLQQYDLTSRANLVVIDWMTAGRRAMGERWAFNCYKGRIKLCRNSCSIFYDSLHLAIEDGPLDERMGRFNVWAAVIAIGPRVAAPAASLIREIADLPLARRSDLVVSAAPVATDGVLVRIAGVSVEQVSLLLRRQLRFLAAQLGRELWSRKW